MKNRGVKSHASAAKKNVLSVPQAGLYQRDSQPVSALSVTRLSERIRKVAQSRVTTAIDGDEPNQPAPTDTRSIATTAANSPAQMSTIRGSRRTPGSERAWHA